MKKTRPSSLTERVSGFPRSWKSAAKRNPPRARELVRERFGEELGDLGRVRSDQAIEIGLHLERAAQDLDRVPVDIEVVVGVLLDAVQRDELREDDGRRAELVEQLDARE